MIVIGLTGPSGSGKGACDAIFGSLGIPYIDTDEVYHWLLMPHSPCTDELCLAFGCEILTPDGHVDRRTLAKVVFSDKSGILTERLNAITHKYVIEETERFLDGYRKQERIAAVIDAPLLIEANMHQRCDFCISVLADKKIRLARIMERDGLDESAARMRLNAQKQDEFYSSNTKYTVKNNGDLTKLKEALMRILRTEGIPVEE